MRGGAAKAEAIPVRGKTLEGKSPGELHALVGLNRRLEVVDSRVEQSLEGEGCSQGLFIMERSASARCFGACDGKAGPEEARGCSNVKKVWALGTAHGCTRGEKLWRANPMSASGMKQGQQARGG
jgi:hypothetical protein